MEDVLHAEMGDIEMSEWIEYTGSDEQNRDILGSKTDVLFRYSNGVHRLRSSMFTGDWKHRTLTHYLIAKPHPYTDLIKIWADTGCPVWVRTHWFDNELREIRHKVYKRNAPDWNIPGAKYSLTPFED